MKASYWRPEDGKIRCLLCPHACLIENGRTGICRVRQAENGELVLPYYGAITALAIDPIEKKPLYHFYPGSRILSLGFVSCNLACPFCQNWEISQTTDQDMRFVSSENLISMAREAGSIGIAFTYSEPLIHFEYISSVAKEARAAGLKTVLVSNGFLREAPAREILSLMDAANIDLKSFSPNTYTRSLRGGLEEVKKIITIAATALRLELTCLLVPGMNDSDQEIEAMSAWIAAIDPEIPFHLSAYHPAWKSTIPATQPSDLARAQKIAKKHLKYVYSGNISGFDDATRCPGCDSVLLSRQGYISRIMGLSGNSCARCGRQIPIILGSETKNPS
jgi:pyruvate formate lyase activating enzyme